MKTLANLKTICQYHGWSDLTTAGTTQLVNFINETLQMLSTLKPWPEYCKTNGLVTMGATETEATITAFADYNSTVAGTTSVTAATHGFSSGDIISITDTTNYNGEYRVYYINANSFYIIKSFVADDATGTATLQIDQKELSELRIWRIGSLIRTDRSVPLDYATHEDWLRLKRYHAGTGSPTHYTLLRDVDTTGNAIRTRLLTYPKHSSEMTMYYTYQVYPTVLSSDTDYTDWPDTRLHLLDLALKLRLASKDRDSGGMSLYSAEFARHVDKAYAFSRPNNRPFIADKTTYNDWKTPIQYIEKTFTT